MSSRLRWALALLVVLAVVAYAFVSAHRNGQRLEREAEKRWAEWVEHGGEL